MYSELAKRASGAPSPMATAGRTLRTLQQVKAAHADRQAATPSRESFMSMPPAERLARACSERNPAVYITLSQWHNARCEEERIRAEKPFDLQAALDSPSSGDAWELVLRNVARWHMGTDVYAPLMFRVNRQFEYCWRLAGRTISIDIFAKKFNRDLGPYTLPLLAAAVRESREQVIQQWPMRRFEVVRTNGTEVHNPEGYTPNHKMHNVQFLGALQAPVYWEI